MTTDFGRSPDGSGSRPTDRASKAVSPVPASIPNAAILARIRDDTRHLTRAEFEEVVALQTEQMSRMICALMLARSVAEEARVEWDEAPAGMKAGKLLIALSGVLPGYRDDIDEIHAALSAALQSERIGA